MNINRPAISSLLKGVGFVRTPQGLITPSSCDINVTGADTDETTLTVSAFSSWGPLQYKLTTIAGVDIAAWQLSNEFDIPEEETFLIHCKNSVGCSTSAKFSTAELVYSEDVCGKTTLAEAGFEDIFGNNNLLTGQAYPACGDHIQHTGVSNLNIYYTNLRLLPSIWESDPDLIPVKYVFSFTAQPFRTLSFGALGVNVNSGDSQFGFNSMFGYLPSMFRFSGGTGVVRLHTGNWKGDTQSINGSALTSGEVDSIRNATELVVSATVTVGNFPVMHQIDFVVVADDVTVISETFTIDPLNAASHDSAYYLSGSMPPGVGGKLYLAHGYKVASFEYTVEKWQINSSSVTPPSDLEESEALDIHTFSWTASDPASDGYNIYVTSSGTFVKINDDPIEALTVNIPKASMQAGSQTAFVVGIISGVQTSPSNIVSFTV